MLLMWLAAAFLAGVLLGGFIALPVLLALAGTVALLVLAYVFRDQRGRAALLVLAASCLGLSRASHPILHPVPGNLAYYNEAHVSVQGVVAAEPDVRDTGANYVVAVSRISIHGTARAVSGRVQVHTARSEQLEYGDSLTLSGKLVAPQNTSALPYRTILAHQGITSLMEFPRVIDGGRTDEGWMGWVVPLRQHLETGIDAWLPEPEAALLIAITLGAKSASLGDLAPVLVATGLIHIVAISGIKVAMVAGTIYQLATLTRRRLLALATSLAVLGMYVLLTGTTASGERSALMWGLVFVAGYLGRGTVTLVSLSLVAALMVALDPTLLTDTGFQLSTVGTFAIVAFAGPLMRTFRYVPTPLREALAVTIAAQVGTLPIVALSFHLVSLTGPLANALVLPLVPILIAVGFLLGALAAIPALAAPLGALAYGLLHLIVVVAVDLHALPGGIPAPNVSALFTIAYYVLVMSMAGFLLGRASWAPVGRWTNRGRELSLALVVGAGLVTVPLARASSEPADGLYWLGSGSSMLLRSENHTALIDGSAKSFALLQRLGDTLPYQVRTLDLVVVTDPRAGNVAGLDEVLRHYSVSEILDVGAEYPSLTYALWRADALSRHIPMYALRTGASVQVGATSVAALGPDALYPRSQDSAGILRLTTSNQSVLLATAASAREQEEAVFRPIHLHAGIVLMDGRKGYSAAFLRAVRPRTIFSLARLRPKRSRGRQLPQGKSLLLTPLQR